MNKHSTVSDGIFIPNVNYEYPKINIEAYIDTNILLKQVMWRIDKARLKDFRFEYKDGEIDDNKNLYADLSSILIHFKIGKFDEVLLKKRKILKRFRKHFYQNKKYYFDNLHLTAKLVLALNLIDAHPVKTMEVIQLNILEEYLENKIDWNDTLKDLWGIFAVTFANKEISLEEKVNIKKYMDKKFDLVYSESIKNIPRIRISKLYHFVTALDFVGLNYPDYKVVLDKLLEENYLQERKTCERTVCTDFDYAYLITKYSWQSNYRLNEVREITEELANIVVNDWNQSLNFFEEYSIPHMYDYLISLSVFQSLFREKFVGKTIPDIHHNTLLYKAN